MATINLQYLLSAENDGMSVSNATAAKAVTPEAGLTGLHHTKMLGVGTSAVAVPLGDVDETKSYWVLLQNLGAEIANVRLIDYVGGAERDSEFADMHPDEPIGPIRMAAQTEKTTGVWYPYLKVKAAANTTEIEVVVVSAGTPA